MFDILRRARSRLLGVGAVALFAVGRPMPVHAEEAKTAAPAEGAAPAEARKEAAGRSARAPEPDDVKRVVYVPESVKAQIREEIKEEVLAQAKRENWAAPSAIPEWLKRFKLKGDVRTRWERSIFGAGNDDTGGFPDFNAINTGKPVNVNLNLVDAANDRFLNVDQNRNRPRLRARLGVDADVGQGFTAGLRLASGDGNTPVSTNQTLGGSPGDFSKYQFWLDRAFIRYAAFERHEAVLGFEIGRFENPFFTTDLLWDDDVNLDGVAMQARFPLPGGVRPFLTAGAFPVFTSAFNFPPERSDKFKSLDKWLYAAQVGADWKVDDSLSVKLAGAFYYFDKIEGRVSGPCDTNLKDIFCDTDESRPAFAQKGNTYMALRTPSDAALAAEASDPNNTPQYQFFGLAARFRELVATASLDLKVAPPLKLWLDGEYVRNVGFSKKQITPVALNNRGPTPDDSLGPYQGGDTGYVGRLTLGSPTQNGRWDWNVSLAYRRVESDAVVDAFTDSDFGLGGTNLKGYVVGAALGLADGVWTSARWMSADAIVGPTFRVDVLQIDVAARF